MRFLFNCCVCIQKFVLQIRTGRIVALGYGLLRGSAGGEVVCSRDLLHACDAGHAGLTRVIVAAKRQDCAISFWKQYPYFTHAAHQRATSATREDSVRGSAKAFRISPLAHLLSSQASKEPCCIFSHPNVIPNYQRISVTDYVAEKRKGRENFLFFRQQRAIQ